MYTELCVPRQGCAEQSLQESAQLLGKSYTPFILTLTAASLTQQRLLLRHCM